MTSSPKDATNTRHKSFGYLVLIVALLCGGFGAIVVGGFLYLLFIVISTRGDGDFLLVLLNPFSLAVDFLGAAAITVAVLLFNWWHRTYWHSKKQR